ncbi:MAG: TlyA family RNA methyltransferase [Paracoccaceae bacterium]
MRLDQRLVEEGFAASRAKAQALIIAGVVEVSGVVAAKPGARANGPIIVTGDPCPWVSRAGLKLAHALDVFELEPAGTALDLGASTGGFTQVLLARGATHVWAVDVGHSQLHADLATDPRVTNLEGLNARDLPDPDIPQVSWITADLSFVSLTKVLPAALRHAGPEAHMIVLVKPQFEAGRGRVGKGGIVTDSAVHAQVLEEISAFIQDLGWYKLGQTDSPVLGGDGNKEFLIAAQNRA